MTANEGIAKIVPDPTGLRRFLTMLFRNGEVKKGGDPKVWEVINSTDFMLLWRSVDAFAPSPIEDVLDKLYAAQEAARPLDVVEEWVSHLDLDAPEVRSITVKIAGGTALKAADLYACFRQQTKEPITLSAFGMRIRDLSMNPTFPLNEKDRTTGGLSTRSGRSEVCRVYRVYKEGGDPPSSLLWLPASAPQRRDVLLSPLGRRGPLDARPRKPAL
jgi:hypothetical protein